MDMKRLLFIAAILLTAVTAQAQDYYAEEYIKSSSPRLSSKKYVSYSNGVIKTRSEGYDPGMGTTVRADELPFVTITIMEGDTIRMYNYNQRVKTYMTMALAVPKGSNQADISVNGNSMAEMAKRAGVPTAPMEREFLGMENIGGYDCHHYRHTSSDGSNKETWVYEPRGITMQRIEGGTTFYLANIRDGAQPASLFELPSDYKPRSVDVGGTNALLDMMQGKGEAGGMLKQGMEDINKKTETKTDPNKSEKERLLETLKQLSGAGKK
jgi:hypothetical protein